jgi:hypothetical protein
VKSLPLVIVSALLPNVALAPVVAQENARGGWHATNNDCFIQAFVLEDRGSASISYSNGTSERGTRWIWGKDGLTIVSSQRGVLLMDGHYEDTVLVAQVDYSTTDDLDFRACSFARVPRP